MFPLFHFFFKQSDERCPIASKNKNKQKNNKKQPKNIEVLSVIAQQLLVLFGAKAELSSYDEVQKYLQFFDFFSMFFVKFFDVLVKFFEDGGTQNFSKK